MRFTYRPSVAAAAVLVFLALPLQAGDPVNLDFEAGLDERGRPVGWRGGGPGYGIAVEQDGAHGGELSARLQSAAEATDKTSAPLVQLIPAQPWRGKRVRLSGWLRTQDINPGWAGLWMRVDSDTAPALAYDNMSNRGVRGNAEWKRYEVVLDVAGEAAEIYFGVVLSGKGTVWADDLKLEEVPKSVATTALPKGAD